MLRRSIAAIFVILAGCNTASDLRQWYVQTDSTPRAEKVVEQVDILEKEPADRDYKVIGIFSPPDNAFDSYGEALKGARRAGALYGADAIVVTAHQATPRIGSGLLQTAGIHLEVNAIVYIEPNKH